MTVVSEFLRHCIKCLSVVCVFFVEIVFVIFVNFEEVYINDKF